MKNIHLKKIEQEEDFEYDGESFDSFSSIDRQSYSNSSKSVADHSSVSLYKQSNLTYHQEEEDFDDMEDESVEEKLNKDKLNIKKNTKYYILPSLFPNRLGTVAFSQFETQAEMETQFERPLRKTILKSSKQKDEGLYYCMPPDAVEFNAIKGAFKRAGFKRTKLMSKCNFLWGKHMKFEKYATLNEYHRYNHFPGTWALGRKDNLHKHLTAMKRKYPAEYDFFPQSFLLPEDKTYLQQEMEKYPGSLYILKPRASSCGRGIKVIQDFDQIKRKECLIQRYIDNPFLINGKKWDLRIYVVVTSFDPLVVYLFDDGLTRFATEAYNNKKTNNRYAHLTNYSINKKSKKFEKNEEGDDDMTGSKWSIKALKRFFKDNNIDDRKLWISIKNLVIKTMIAVESSVNSLTKRFLYTKGYPCYEIFGFDVLVDSNLKPWIIEVNVSPSLSSSSPLDKKIKGRLMTEMFHLIGCTPYSRKQQKETSEQEKKNRLFGIKPATSGHAASRNYLKRTLFELQRATQLDYLTYDEKEVIMHFEDQFSRRGHFDRIFPSKDNYFKYSKLFENERYNNVLLAMFLKESKSIQNTLLLSPDRLITKNESEPKSYKNRILSEIFLN